jgi:cytochrome P450 family 9
LSHIGCHRFIRSFIALKFTGLGTDDIAAQALVFFSAGFEVVATLLSFSTLLLAVHQDIQKQAREEVNKVLAEHGGQVTYEAVQSIKYLDNILSGTGK